VAYNFPIYRSPSVPKLNRTNISSPLKGNIGSAGLQINKSNFSFKKSSLGSENLISENKEQSNSSLNTIKSIGSSLNETNRILIEIQNQLAIDFSTRIVEDRKQIGEIKKQKFRKAAFNKEAALESIQGVGKGLFKQVDKVLTPAKSLFQKIIEFFKTILTGLVVNTALNWLSKKENQEKVKVFFQFLADHWKWIVGTLIAGKLLGGLLGVIGVVGKIKGAIDLLRGKGKLPGGGKGGPLDCSAILKCLKGAPEFANVLSYYMRSNPKVYGTIEGIAKGVVQAPLPPLVGPAGAPLNIPVRPPGIPSTTPRTSPQPVSPLQPPQANPVSPPGLSPAIWGAIIEAIKQILLPNIFSPAAAQPSPNSYKPASGGGLIDNIPSKKCSKCSIIPSFSQGGSVGGSGSGTVDSVPAMLAPGEYVIRTAASKLFRPLLSDINENAGRLWNYFREAVTKLLEVTSLQQSNSERFSTILEDLNNTFKQKKQRESLKKIATGDLTGGGKGGGFGRSLFEKAGQVIGTQKGKSTGIPGGGFVGGEVGRQKGGQMYDNIIQKIPNVNMSPVQNNVNIVPLPIRSSSIQQITKSSSNSSPVIIPINLPTKKAALPKINLPQAPATYVPSIPASNASNPYMILTPSLYGIFV
jgi:hypothetical protein